MNTTAVKDKVVVRSVRDVRRIADPGVFVRAVAGALKYFNWLTTRPAVDVEVKVREHMVGDVALPENPGEFYVTAALVALTLGVGGMGPFDTLENAVDELESIMP